MPAKINLKDQVFERLTVVKETSQRDKRGSIIWECRCNCGNTAYVSSNALRSGHTRSCGCLMKDTTKKIGHQNLIDITGQTFGLLTVIKRGKVVTENNGCLRSYWICRCKCGSEVEVMGKLLRNGNTQSCGCIKSLGEQKIIQLLQQAKIPYEREKTFNDLTSKYGGKPRFDFFVDNRYIIEYDGKQHFQDYSWGKFTYTAENAQERDMIKNIYCFNHNIPIIRIPYTAYTNLSLSDLLLETSQFIVKPNNEKKE